MSGMAQCHCLNQSRLLHLEIINLCFEQCHGEVFRSGFDGKKYGACPACQRVFMVLMLKAARPAPGLPRLQFLVATVPPGKPPMELKRHGLRNLPAIIYRFVSTKTPSELFLSSCHHQSSNHNV